MIIPGEKVMKILRRDLSGKWSKNRKVAQLLADDEYWAGPEEAYFKIIKQSKVDQEKWIAEKHDCDDFAHLLKADFIEAAYKDGKRRRPYCFGIVWGMLPRLHAINWYIPDDLKLRFCEPRNDKVFYPRETDKDIFLVLA